MNSINYVSKIAELNASKLSPGNLPEVNVSASFFLGFLEEILELEEALTDDDLLKEAGDVLAYFTLLYLQYLEIEETAALLDSVLSYDLETAEVELLELLSNFKRVFRENEPLVDINLWNALRYAIRYSGYSFTDVAAANIQKLTRRGDIFRGRGDNR
jgi:hypothetical protein